MLEADGAAKTTTEQATVTGAVDPAVTQTAGNDAAQSGSTTAANDQPDLFAKLDDPATREWVKKRHGDDVAKLAKQAFELDKFAGNALKLPAENAPESEWTAFYEKLRPAGPEGMAAIERYGFQVPKDLPETVPYDADEDAAFAKDALELGITKKQATALRDRFIQRGVAKSGSIEQSMKQELQKLVDGERAKLEQLWGPIDGETAKANLQLADRFFKSIDKDGELRASLEKAGWLGPNKEVLNHALAKAFAAGGAALWAEDTKVSANPGLLDNPFEQGDKCNFTNASRLVASDPDRARVLCLAAGRNPADYGMK